jgi:hypothetical protein
MAIDIVAIRKALGEVVDKWQTSTDNVNPQDIFFPSRHLRALDLRHILVVGMRGSGKSFWTKVLHDPGLRDVVTMAHPKLQYERITEVCPLRWDDRTSDDLPDASRIDIALNNGIEARAIWLTLFLHVLRKKLQKAQIPLEMPEGENWSVKFEWTKSNPEFAMKTLWELDRQVVKDEQVVMVLIDALDRVTTSLDVSHRCVRGLFELLLEFIRSKGLRFKAFVREDMVRDELFNFPDASKLSNDAVWLEWSREELYALVWKKLANQSSDFRDITKGVLKSDWTNNAGVWNHQALEMPGEDMMEAVLKLFSNTYMGKSAKKGRTYSYWFNHLSDGLGRVSPRTFETSFKSALESNFDSNATNVLMPSDIHEGVRAASNHRVAELQDDYQWISLAMKAFKSRAVPVTWETIRSTWSSESIKKKIETESAAQHFFIPWSRTAEDRAVLLRLRDVLETIGVIKLRNDGVKVDIPDIYRVGFGVGKRGGIRQ